MAITIRKMNFKKSNFNESEDEVKEIFQSIENYLNKNMEHRRVLIAIEDSSEETDTCFGGELYEATYNHTSMSLARWLVCAALRSEAKCIGLLHAVNELSEIIRMQFPREFELLSVLSSDDKCICFAKLVKKLSEELDNEQGKD